MRTTAAPPAREASIWHDVECGGYSADLALWAELAALSHDLDEPDRTTAAEHLRTLQPLVDQRFQEWTLTRYGSLSSLPSDPPVMLHHVPRWLARRLRSTVDSRCALLVLDGLAFEQWSVLRGTLHRQRPELVFDERAVFAWVPTITSVSRQAIFAGLLPRYFPRSIGGTAAEPALWTRFWMDQGLLKRAAGYAKRLGTGDLQAVAELVERPGLRVIGLVVDTVDLLLHGAVLGSGGLQAQVRHWAEQGFMARLLDLLLDAGFAVYLTSDHGNVEAAGIGRPAEGVLAAVRGERSRIFPTESLRDSLHGRFPAAIAWPPLGLPPDFYPLLAPARGAFVGAGETVVSHGGISLEELIVPLVQIRRSAGTTGEQA